MEPCRDKKILNIDDRGSSSAAVTITPPVLSVIPDQLGDEKGGHGESVIFSIVPGLRHPVRVVLAAQKEGKTSRTNMTTFPNCQQCKEKYFSREICRVELSHTALPWKDTYLCITMDETCFVVERRREEEPSSSTIGVSATSNSDKSSPRLPCPDHFYIAKGREESEELEFITFLTDALFPPITSTIMPIDSLDATTTTISTTTISTTTESVVTKIDTASARTIEIEEDLSCRYEYPVRNKYTDKQLHCTRCKKHSRKSKRCREELKHLGLPWSCKYFTLFIATDEERVSIQAEEKKQSVVGAQMKSIVDDIFSMEDRPPFSNTFMVSLADKSKFEINISENTKKKNSARVNDNWEQGRQQHN